MNPEDLLVMAAEAIDNRDCRPADTWHVCYFEGKIQCLPTWHCQLRHPVFIVLHSLELEQGLSTGQWNKLRTKLANFWLEIRT